MKVLLVAVNAKYIHTNLAVHSLKAYANKYHQQIGVLEYTINHSCEDILKGIYKENADVVAFSCYIWNIDMVTQIMAELRKILPKAKIWFGGPEVSYDSSKYLKTYGELDGIMIGEGEQTFLELMEYYVEGEKSLSSIAGLAYKESACILPQKSVSETNITVTPARGLTKLDDIPFPYDDMNEFKNKIIYYESSRGCPFSCSYCLSSIDKRVRFRGIELVKKELKIFMDHNVPQVKFVDRTFNCNKKHAMEIWKFIKDNDNGITNFHFEIAADLLEEEELEILKTLRQGQIQFEIGVQSTNPQTVTAIHRKMDLDKLSYNVKQINQGQNIHQHLDLIAGLPMEGLEAFSKSFDDVYDLRPDQLQLGFLKILKGSMMEEDRVRYGIVHRDTPPYEVLYTDDLSYGDLLILKGVCEMVETYYNSGQFQYSMQFLEKFYDSSMKLYLDLSQYFEENRLDMLAHSRIRKYEILLDFYQKKVLKTNSEDFINVFKELLILDIYLREDMKSRPVFAKDTTEYKNKREWFDSYKIDRKSAHMEKFTYDIFASCETGQPVRQDVIVLFDYSNRDALSNSAKTMIIKEGKET